MTIALAASLAANVFLGGFVAGRLSNPPPPSRAHVDAPRGGADAGASRVLGASLAQSEAARAAVRAAARRGDFMKDREAALRLRLAARDALAADPFDRAAARAALGALAAHHAEREEVRTSFLLDVFEALPPEERAEVVEAFGRAPQRRPGRGGGRHREGRGPGGGPSDGFPPPGLSPEDELPEGPPAERPSEDKR